jgi:two-component system cell cycle response regulator
MYKDKFWPSSHLESVPRSFWFSMAFAGAFLGIYGGLAICKYVITADNPVSTDVATTLAAFASFVIAWIGHKRVREERRAASVPASSRLHFWVPLAFSGALLMQGFGNSILVYYDIYSPETLPIVGLIVLLGMYPALLAGIFLLPREALLGKVPLQFVLESLMLIVTVLTMSWYFLLGPIFLESQGLPIFAMAILAAYALFDLLIISCLILLSRSISHSNLRNAVRVLSLAMVLFVLVDSILLFQGLHGKPSTIWLSLGWSGGCFAIALALQVFCWPSTSSTTTNVSTPHTSALVAMPLWRSLVTYTLIPVDIGLVFSAWSSHGKGLLVMGTYACGLLLLILIFAKQLLTIRETHGLNRGFQRLNRLVDEKNAALQQANARLEALATTDPLTELPNHRALVAALDQELVRSEQYQRSCSLLFFDLDHFKALNDGYGHAGGDIALCEFGSLLRSTLPQIHTVGRWGGEEFIAILPEQTTEEAADIAEELCSAVASHTFGISGGIYLTCSIGIASFPAHAQQQEPLLQAADAAMYAAKRLGRNQIRVIDDPAVIALLATNAAVEGRDEVTLIGTVHALALLVEKHDKQTGECGQRVGDLLLQLAPAFGLSETEGQLLSLVGQLHDVGKIVIPDNILQKQAEELTEQELACLRQHPLVGAEVISSIPSLCSLAPMITSHHEWWNGSGYPNHQAGEAIPLGARLLAVVDAYVSMTKAQSAATSEEHERALVVLRQGAGTQFDPAIVEQFLLLLARMPGARDLSMVSSLSRHL